MTQSGHTFVALIVLLVGYQIIFHTILKYHPVTKRNIKELSEFFKDIFLG